MTKYDKLKKEYIKGWHTWNVNSVLSHVHMPDGFSINIGIKEYKNGGYLPNTLIGRFQDKTVRTPKEIAYPGTHSLDEKYTNIEVEWCNLRFKVESATIEEDLVILITPIKNHIKPPMIVFEFGYLWNRKGRIIRENEIEVEANNGESSHKVYVDGDVKNDDPNLPCKTQYIPIVFDKSISLSTGKRRSVNEVEEIVKKNRAEVFERYKKYKNSSDLIEAVECAMGWDTIYDAKNDRVISPVSRLWSIGSGGYVLFCWDNYFAGYMASLSNKELAYSNIIEITNEKTNKGFVPNYSYGTGQKSEDRSQPPVGSTMLLEVYKKYKDKWILKELYPSLYKWNTWYYNNRRSESGAFCWGSNPIEAKYGNQWESNGVNDTYGGALESGLDNSPMYDDVPFDKQKHIMKLEDVGLTGLFIADCKALIQIADILGKKDDIEELKERKKNTQSGLETLWDEENGFYYNKYTDKNEFSRRISPCNFYALFDETIPKNRVKRIIEEHYFNEKEFYGEWIIPSIAKNDESFKDQDYWRGRIWAPLNFLVYLAFKEHNLSNERKDLAKKSKHLFMKEWKENKHIHENYNGITGAGCDAHNSDKFYHWGALLCMIGIMEEREED